MRRLYFFGCYACCVSYEGNASDELSKLEGDLSSFSDWTSGVEAQVDAIEKKRCCGPLSGAEMLLDQQKVTITART